MKKFLPILGATLLLGIATSSYGATAAKALDKQERREKNKIAKAEQSGKLSEAQAHDLKEKENRIETEKSEDIAKHHGHLTKAEAKHLKHEEKQLKKETKRDIKSA